MYNQLDWRAINDVELAEVYAFGSQIVATNRRRRAHVDNLYVWRNILGHGCATLQMGEATSCHTLFQRTTHAPTNRYAGENNQKGRSFEIPLFWSRKKMERTQPHRFVHHMSHRRSEGYGLA